jgi:hypothetical protein
MKKLFFILFVISVSFFPAQAFTTRITSGQVFISGSSYNTPNYQTYLAFDFIAIRPNPRVEYNFFGVQNFSVYQNHPVRPDGPYIFTVKMPYTPDGIFINNVLKSPVWYSDCVWDIQSSAQTPLVEKGSPQFITVNAPFRMNGRMTIYGAAYVATRVTGFGTSDLKFENIGGRYHLAEARYFFGNSISETKNSTN